LSLGLAVALSCAGEAPLRLVYERCDPGDRCTFGMQCLRAPHSAQGTGPASLCTRTCSTTQECPSLDGQCVRAPGEPQGLCYRGCTLGCRVGTWCDRTSVPGVGRCVPIGSTGPPQRAYQRCEPVTLGAACQDGTTCTAAVLVGDGAATCTEVGCTDARQCPGYLPRLVACLNLSGLASQAQCVRLCDVHADCAPWGTRCEPYRIGERMGYCLPEDTRDR
jgi:hypothetical protein